VKLRSASRGITLLELMIVLALVGLMVGLTFSTAGAGLDAIRLRSAADSVAALLSRSLNRVERAQEPVEILFNRDTGAISARGLTPLWKQDLKLPEGVVLASILPAPPGEEPIERSVFLLPGAASPGIAVELANRRGQRRRVRIDPVVGTPHVEAPLQVEGEVR
jgi:prepilin-type N-terminal cleavage/methylation domain-containing protein